MPNYGTVTFHNARASGIEVYQLGSGSPDHLGFFGSAGTSDAIPNGSYNGSIIIVDSNGTVPAYLGSESGKLTNCKWASASTVEISGWGAVEIDTINIFDTDNLDTYPDFKNRPSGALMIRYCASGTNAVRTYNAKLYAYELGGVTTSAPPDVTINAFEINASGQTRSAAYSGVWTTCHGSDNALLFDDHSAANGWEPHTEHLWVAAISAKPNAVGILDQWSLAFQLQFA